MTRDEFLDRTTSKELTEIIIRDRLEPYDLAGRIELAVAKLCSLFYNVHRNPDRGEALSSEHWLPKFGQYYRDMLKAESESTEGVVVMTPDQMREQFEQIRITNGQRTK